ncbi:MAG: bifunctional oligoribonuclease/PAP phosphatase NrnA [Candidatus Zixiibacteriota bacterium]
MNNKFADIKHMISEAHTILITSHVDPDGDSLGSLSALYRYLTDLGKEVVALNDGEIPKKYEFLPELDKIINVEKYHDNQSFDLNIILECPTRDRCGRVENYLSSKAPIINIDHHPDNVGYGEIDLIDETASAVGEILTDYFIETGYKISEDTATVLYAAILTDTGRFRFNSTTSKTMLLAGKLIDFGANPRRINDRIYYSIPANVLKLTGKLLSELKTFNDGQICMISLEKYMLNGCKYNPSDTEGMAEFVMYDQNVKVGGFFRELDTKKTKVSLRSNSPYDISRIAHKYGGGGHLHAAGFTIELPIVKAREQLLTELQELINAAV